MEPRLKIISSLSSILFPFPSSTQQSMKYPRFIPECPIVERKGHKLYKRK